MEELWVKIVTPITRPFSVRPRLQASSWLFGGCVVSPGGFTSIQRGAVSTFPGRQVPGDTTGPAVPGRFPELTQHHCCKNYTLERLVVFRKLHMLMVKRQPFRN